MTNITLKHWFGVRSTVLGAAALCLAVNADAGLYFEAASKITEVRASIITNTASWIWIPSWRVDLASAGRESPGDSKSDSKHAIGLPGQSITVTSIVMTTVFAPASSGADIGADSSVHSLRSLVTGTVPPEVYYAAGGAEANFQQDFMLINGSGPVKVRFEVRLETSLKANNDGPARLVRMDALVRGKVTGTGSPVEWPLYAGLAVTNFVNPEVDLFLSDRRALEADLESGQAYSIRFSTDAEVVVEGIPEPAEGAFYASVALLLVCAGDFLKRRRRRRAVRVLLALALLCLTPTTNFAYRILGDTQVCSICCDPACTKNIASSIDFTRGELLDDYPAASIRNSEGATVVFTLFYSSGMTTDDANTAAETPLGIGWTHSYGSFLFRQQGEVFFRDHGGRVRKFTRLPMSSPETYRPGPGYYERLVEQTNGTFLMTYKDGTTETYTNLPASPYFCKSAIYPLARSTDRNQNSTVLSYDASGRLSAITDPYGRRLTLAYNAWNRIAAITNVLGEVTRLDYTPLGTTLVRITDPANAQVNYSYDHRYRLIQKVDKRGVLSRYRWSSPSLTNPHASVSAEVVDWNGAVIPLLQVTNPAAWALDQNVALGSLTKSYLPAWVTNRDARGFHWANAYDQKGRITTEIAPDGATRRFTYDPVTLLKSSSTDAYNRMTFFQYDSWGNLLLEQDCANNVTSYTYEPVFHLLTSTTDPNGFVTTNHYDARGNLLEQTDPLGYSREWTYDARGQVIVEKDKNGNLTRYAYDQYGNRIYRTNALGYVTSATYDLAGNLRSHTDANGQTTWYAYDVMNRLIAETNIVNVPLPPRPTLGIKLLPAGYVEVFWGGSSFRLVAATNVAGPFEEVWIGGRPVTNSPFMTLLSLTNEAVFYALRLDPVHGSGEVPLVNTYSYDAAGNRTRVTDPGGHTTRYTYDERNRLSGITNALGGVISYRYDAAGNRIAESDARTNTTHYAYDAHGRLIYTTNALSGVTAYGYDLVGNRISATDALGRTTRFAYDCLGRAIAQTNALLCVSFQAYDAPDGGGCGCGVGTRGSGNITKQTDANGKVTYFKFDKLGRLLKTIRKQGDSADVIDDDDAVTSYSYDPNGNRLLISEPNGTWVSYAYDTMDRQTNVLNCAGDRTATAYDPVGNVQAVQPPNGNVTLYTYDSRNRLLSVEDSIGPVATYTYDADGLRITALDGNGNGPTSGYDELHRLSSQTDAMRETTTYGYDANGNQLQVTDREGHVTRYTYDALNRRISTTDALNCTTTYAYDAVGNLLGITDANLHTTSYQYDHLNRLVTEIYPDLPGLDEPPNSNKRFFTYDCVGNLTGRTDQKGVTTIYSYSDLYFLTQRGYQQDPDDFFTYDLAGRMLTASKTNWLWGTNWLVTFDYDCANRVTNTAQGGRVVAYDFDIPGRTRSLTYPSGTNITETYDSRGRLLLVGDGPVPPIATYWYDPGNRVVARAYRNGVVAQYEYSPNNWITWLIHAKPATATIIGGFHYSYDKEGNKHFEENLWNPNRSEAYAYDPIYRLTNWVTGRLANGTISAPTNSQQWQLDCLGNWMTTTTNGVPEFRSHNPANEITAIQTAGGPVGLVFHDFNGNLTNDGRYVYAYDEENRLLKATRLFLIAGDTSPRLVGQYTYDALGRPTAKRADPDPAALPMSVVYLHDATRIIEELDPNGTALAVYTYGNYIDEALTMQRAGHAYYYQQNALWSVIALTDAAGDTVERNSYNAYGPATVTEGSGDALPPNVWGTAHSEVGNPHLFTGRQLAEETGLYYYRARHYAGFLGRFLQRDPVGYLNGLNLVSYVFNRPVRLVDPMGTTCCAPDGTLVQRSVTQVIYEEFGWGYHRPLAKDPSSSEVQVAARLTVFGNTQKVKLGGKDLCKFNNTWHKADVAPLPDADEDSESLNLTGPIEYWKNCGEPAEKATFGPRSADECVQCVQYNWEVKMEEELDYWKDVGLEVGISAEKGGLGAGLNWSWQPFAGADTIANPILQVRICADNTTWAEVKGAMRGATGWSKYRPSLAGWMYSRYRGETY